MQLGKKTYDVLKHVCIMNVRHTFTNSYFVLHSNLDIVNKFVRSFLFTTSNVICLVYPQNGSWVLFTISQNSLYWGLLYQGLSVVLQILKRFYHSLLFLMRYSFTTGGQIFRFKSQLFSPFRFMYYWNTKTICFQ